MKTWLSAFLALVIGPVASIASQPVEFDTTKLPVSPSGVRAVVDLPADQHIRNTGGRDGAGLCVFTSCEIAGRWQNVAALNGFQKYMTRQPGGGWPQKLDQMIGSYCKSKGVAPPSYVQHTGGDPGFLDLAIRTRRAPCVTYSGRDGFYAGPVAHMVNAAYLDSTSAAIIDNNRPGSWVWMTRDQFVSRWQDMEGGWAVVFLDPPPPVSAVNSSENNECDLAIVNCNRESPQSGEWIQNQNGREWGYWVASRCVARTFGDGRCFATDGLGNSTGAEIDSPAPLPVPLAAKPVAVEDANYGVERTRIPQGRRYWLNGRECSRDEALSSLSSGLVDDSDRFSLSVIGDETVKRAVVQAFATDPKLQPFASKIHLQVYDRTNWVVRDRLKATVTLQAPAPKGGAVLWTAQQADPATLAEGLKHLDPNPTPAPRPPEPTPTPSPEPGIGHRQAGWCAAALTLAALLFHRKKR